MDVLGHDDVRPQREPMVHPGAIQGFDEPRSSSIAKQERLPPETRKRQRVGVARCVDSAAALSMRGVFHLNSAPVVPLDLSEQHTCPRKRGHGTQTGRHALHVSDKVATARRRFATGDHLPARATWTANGLGSHPHSMVQPLAKTEIHRERSCFHVRFYVATVKIHKETGTAIAMGRACLV